MKAGSNSNPNRFNLTDEAIPEINALQVVQDHHEVLPLGGRPGGNIDPVVGL